MTERPRKVLGFPVKDAVLINAAGFVAGATVYVYSMSVPAATVAALIGGLWFLLGCAYGYGEAMRI